MFKVFDIPGNTGPLQHWLSKFGPVQTLSADAFSSKAPLDDREILCVPGGNNFANLGQYASDLAKELKQHRRCVFICGAFQALFETSDESEEGSGLGMFRGNVNDLGRFHIGFEQIATAGDTKSPSVYFNHRFGVEHVVPLMPQENTTVFRTNDGLVAAILSRQIFATQFHPELSLGHFDECFEKWLAAE